MTCKLMNSANLYQFDTLKYCLEEQPPPSRTSGLETQMQCLQKMLQELKAEVTALYNLIFLTMSKQMLNDTYHFQGPCDELFALDHCERSVFSVFKKFNSVLMYKLHK